MVVKDREAAERSRYKVVEFSCLTDFRIIPETECVASN